VAQSVQGQFHTHGDSHLNPLAAINHQQVNPTSGDPNKPVPQKLYHNETLSITTQKTRTWRDSEKGFKGPYEWAEMGMFGLKWTTIS